MVETAEPFREALSERGVLLVVLPAYGSGAADAADVPPLTDADLRCVTVASGFHFAGGMCTVQALPNMAQRSPTGLHRSVS